MSWDIVLFSSNQKISAIDDIDEKQLTLNNFGDRLTAHFNHVTIHNKHHQVKGATYSLDYFWDGGEASNIMISIYGEDALFELVGLAKKHNWQIFDTSLGQMINLDDPSLNGCVNFCRYVHMIITHKQ